MRLRTGTSGKFGFVFTGLMTGLTTGLVTGLTWFSGRIILFLSGHLEVQADSELSSTLTCWATMEWSILLPGGWAGLSECILADFSKMRTLSGTIGRSSLLGADRTMDSTFGSSCFWFNFNSSQLKRGKSVANRKLASPSFTTSGSAIQDLSFSLTRPPRRNFDTGKNKLKKKRLKIKVMQATS